MKSAPQIKVLHLITELSTGGAQTTLLNLLTHFDNRSYCLKVVCYFNGQSDIAHRISRREIEVIDLNMKSKFNVGSIWHLNKLIREFQPTILHTWMYHANISGRVLGFLNQSPIVITTELTMKQESKMRLRINKMTGSFADSIVCISENVASYAVEKIGLPKDKVLTTNYN